MLASTVQFSRYGRRSNFDLRVHQQVPFEELDAEPSSTITALKAGLKARSLRTQQCAYATRTNERPRSTRLKAGVLVADVRWKAN
jgi:hypothetical protein